MQETCVNITGCRGARLLVWLILNDRVQPSFIAGVLKVRVSGVYLANRPLALILRKDDRVGRMYPGLCTF